MQKILSSVCVLESINFSFEVGVEACCKHWFLESHIEGVHVKVIHTNIIWAREEKDGWTKEMCYKCFCSLFLSMPTFSCVHWNTAEEVIAIIPNRVIKMLYIATCQSFEGKTLKRYYNSTHPYFVRKYNKLILSTIHHSCKYQFGIQLPILNGWIVCF